jgi:error-prone DNA polymerase
MAKGLAAIHAARIVAARAAGPFTSIEDVWQRSGVPVAALEHIADADGFASLGFDRRQALWRVKALGEAPLPLFAAADACEEGREPAVALTPMSGGREVVEDYRSLQLSLRAHPLAFLRADLAAAGVTPCAALASAKDGRRVTVAGIVLVRQRPGSTNVTFITIEDEGGIANLIVWANLFEKYRRIVMSASMLKVEGIVQREGLVTHIIAQHIEDASPMLSAVGEMHFPHRLMPADGASGGGAPDPREKRIVRTRDVYIAPNKPVPQDIPDLPLKSRDFH